MANANGGTRSRLKRLFSNLAGKRWLTREMLLRMVADAVMVNAALVAALTLRFLWLVTVEGGIASVYGVLSGFARTYLSTFPVLTGISLVVFYASGFYTHGRAYSGRYKALTIAQAVTTSYLVYGFGLFMLRDVLPFPRTALFLAWLLTLVLLIGARLGAKLWSTFAAVEQRLLSAPSVDGEIRDVLVIGGAGYIGSALVERLLQLGYRVGVLDLLLYGDAPIADFYEHPRFELIEGDFRHIDTVVRASQGRDAVVHLGAIVGDPACSICEDLAIEINVEATRTIAEIGKGFGVKRLVFASTCSVYGASDEILDERSALNPISLYARTKLASEKVLLRLANTTFAPTILRFGTIYGLSGRPRFDLVVNLLTAKAIQDGEAAIFGGKQWRPLVHVRDAAEAIVLALRAPFQNVRGQIFNVGSNEQNYQIADVGLIIKEMVPASRVVNRPDEDNRNYRVRFDKIHNVLGFRPQYTVREGVCEIIEAFATGKITDYRASAYSNYTFLNQNGTLPHLSGYALMDRALAIRWAAEQIKQRGLSLDTVLAALHEARGSVFEEVFTLSWFLLNDETRRILMVMPIFATSAAKAAIEAASDVYESVLEEGLSQLVEMSLVEAINELDGGKRRYRVHPLARVFAQRKLEEDREWERAARTRVAGYFYGIAKEYGRDNWQGYPVVEEEIHNIFGMMDWCYQANEWRMLIDFAQLLDRFMNVYSYWQQRLAYAEQVQQGARKLHDKDSLARALLSASWTFYYQGRYGEAEKCAQEARDIFEASKDSPGLVTVRLALGSIANRQGNLEQSEELLNEALASAEALENESLVRDTKVALAAAAYCRQDYDSLQRLLDDLLTTIQDPYSMGRAMGFRGVVALAEGKYQEARESFERALSIHQRTGRQIGVAHEKRGLAQVEEATGDLQAALRLARESLEIFERWGTKKHTEEMKGMIEFLERRVGRD